MQIDSLWRPGGQSRWLGLFIVLLFAGLASPRPALAQDVFGIIEAAADALLGNGANAGGRGRRAAEVAAEPRLPAQPAKKLQARLELLSRCYQTWLEATLTLTDEQRVKLAQLLQAELAQDPALFIKPIPRLQATIPRDLPVLFGLHDGPADAFTKSVNQSLKANVLSAEQSARLDAALAERARWLRQAYCQYFVAMVDEHLFLTTDQREKVLASCLKSARPPRHAMYQLGGQVYGYYMPIESASAVMPPDFKKILETCQARCLELTDGNDQQPNYFSSNEGRPAWEKKLAEMNAAGRVLLRNAVEVRVRWATIEYDLNPDQVARLQVAGKGAATTALSDWRENARSTLDSIEQQMQQQPGGGNMMWGVGDIDGNSIGRNPFWTAALTAVRPRPSVPETPASTPDPSSPEPIPPAPDLPQPRPENAARRPATNRAPPFPINSRERFRHASGVAATLAMLDQELWLTPNQREALRSEVAKSIPAQGVQHSDYTQYLGGLILLAQPMCWLDADSLSSRLRPAQRETWDEMKKIYRFNAGNSTVSISFPNWGNLQISVAR